jgi:iron complex outermembrane receptor protein
VFDRGPSFHARLLCSAAVVSMVAVAGPAAAQERSRINIDPQPLVSALNAFGVQTGQPVISTPELTGTKTSPGVRDAEDPAFALAQLLSGTGLSYRCSGDTYLIVKGPQAGPAPTRCIVQSGAGGSEGASGTVEALIVTAQKREEDIQDVPIAMSAFSQEALEKSQIAGGPDLMTQIPNMTFTKTNFASYSIQIRGIGTQAISATTDPAVAVAFNNTPFVRNRFFEQEFYDLQRVEVLRGPQGTLYGRNATAGVVNIISQKPKFAYEAKLSGDVANYNSMRLEGMINTPLIEDVLALRIAGAWTKRDGYVTNQITGNPIDGRDLWSTRVSLRFEPTDWISANLIWEHFQEDDDRLRSGKQLCKKDPTKTEIAGIQFPNTSAPGQNSTPQQTFNQGCLPSSLYSPDSFQTPNGFSLPYYQPLSQLALPTVTGLDPYLSTIQSRDLRVIESTVDPHYRARTDTAELQINFDITDNLALTSETAYSVDELFSTQDYNRFNTAPGAFDQVTFNNNSLNGLGILDENGVFCDPQIGCADRLVAVDLSTADSRHFSQEFRVGSDFDGPFNFSLGANFLRYDTEDKYYVFINTLTLYSAMARSFGPYLPEEPYVANVSDNRTCVRYLTGDPNVVQDLSPCIYIDPNPIGSLNDLGHNYFLSKNPYRLISYAAFGEVYYNVTDNLKLTGGLRWTVDKKHAPQIPSWLLASNSVGYPVKEIVDAEWREPTGRLAIDWKPDLSFTDETLLYASYAHGYKAGGANPPPMVVVAGQLAGVANVVESVLHPKTFDAEFVNAFEVGAKNTLFDSRLTLNTSAFYYDYKGYQISQIIDRTAVNSNFDAEVWGIEVEADWRPLENLRLGFKGGYENTRVADGEQAVDVMDRLAGHTDWVLAKPFPALPSNCILPLSLITFGNRINTVNSAGFVAGDVGYCAKAYIAGFDPVTELPYVPNPTIAALGPNGTLINLATFQSGRWLGYSGFDPASAPNNGAGFYKDLSGNELPNAPHFTGTLTADYTVPLRGDWMVNLHADLYYQSEAWTRIFNTEGYDKLKAYTNVNLAAIFTNEDAGWKVMAYVKNVMDRDSITGAFLNSDDSGLTTNVFLTEPRLYGLRVTKEFSDVPLLGSLVGERREHSVGEPYPFTAEFGGGINRLQSDTDIMTPKWLNAYLRTGNYPLAPQDYEIDRGDQRQARLTYALNQWRVSVEGRWGVAKGEAFGDDSGNFEVCGLITFGTTSCGSVFVWGATTVHDREEYEVGDALVGHELASSLFGEGGSSVVGLGVRYANLTSKSLVEDISEPDHIIPPGDVFSTPRLYHDYITTLDADRTFKGVGPLLSWEASSVLFGGRESGHLNVDWNLSGGMLYGKQKVLLSETTRETITSGTLIPGFVKTIVPPTVETIRQSEEDVQIPTYGATIGLSYSLDWIKVGAGYRWERYGDAIDGGFTERHEFDRTIDGPYFKLTLGFGG